MKQLILFNKNLTKQLYIQQLYRVNLYIQIL